MVSERSLQRHLAYYAVYLLSTFSISLQRSSTPLHISTTITEGLSPGSPLIDLRQHMVTPPDRLHHFSLNVQPTFSVGQHQNLFSVIGTVLTTASAIDRESICFHSDSLCVLRLDIGVESAGHFEVLKVEITVLDLNDNSPTFRQSSLNLSVPESNPPGILLQILSAYDLDSSHNSEISYRLESGEALFRLIAVQSHSNGSQPTDLRLELTGSLDREERSHYDVEVLAVDGGHPPRTGTLQIAIEVTDLNDNNPRFNNDSYDVSLDRSVPPGTVVTTVHAHDPDDGLNGQVRYHLARKTQVLYGRIFSVDAVSGDVKTNRHLDSGGLRTSYNLFIIAEDLGENPTPTVVNLVVHLQGANDHEPQISIHALNGEATTAHLQENSFPGSFVAHVTIYDPDVGRDGQTECQLNSQVNFSLVALRDKEYKLVALNSFDREERDEYQVVVRCWDLGETSLTSSLNLSIIIADEDDNAPIFTRSTYEVSVPENNKKNSFLLQVHATDADIGPNAQVRFALDPDAENWFHVDPESGVITALISFDREFVDQFDFHVIARGAEEESGSGIGRIHSGHVARSRVHVTVTDVDDEPPRFSQSWYKLEVAENENSGKVVGQVTAVDEDLPPFNSFSYHLEYSPDDGSSSNHFAVDPVSGVIYTRQTLDREALSHYTLRIRAQGDVNAALSDVTVVFIRVSDVNDNAPVFKFPADDDVIRLPSRNLSGATDGESLATIRAFDRDLDRNADLTYSILSGNENKAFLLDPKSGKLSWNSDSAPSYQANCFTNLIVQVKDGGHPNPLQTTTQVRLVCDDHFVVHQSDGFGGGGSSAGGEDRGVRGLSGVHFLILASVLACCIVVVIVLLAAICVTRDQTRAMKKRGDRYKGSDGPKGTKAPMGGGGGGGQGVAGGVKESDLLMLDRQKVSLDDGETIVLALHHFDLLRIASLNNEQVSK